MNIEFFQSQCRGRFEILAYGLECLSKFQASENFFVKDPHVCFLGASNGVSAYFSLFSLDVYVWLYFRPRYWTF